MRGEAPADFYSAVTEGRGEMPAYRDLLSSDERWDVVFYVWRLSTSADILEHGRTLYESDCGACHGEQGSGQLLGSADFTDLRQMDNLAPRDLYLTVTQGRGSMPAWQSLLSQDDRWAVIDYLRTFSYDPHLESEVAMAGPTPTSADTVEPSACDTAQANIFDWENTDAIQAGQALYLVQCAMCHGPDGSGGLPQTPDFTSVEINDMLLEDPGPKYCSLTDGLGVMPAFGASLTEEERWQVITYMGSLGP
jgi:mono/diheme cytochrome c family protein